MATTRDIKRRIRSVANTQQITKAMKMVAAAKLRRTRERLDAMRPYVRELESMVGSALGAAPEAVHPLLAERTPVRNTGLLLLTSDRGLCGAFNGNLIRRALQFVKEQPEDRAVKLILAGRKAVQFFRGKKEYEINAVVEDLFDDATPASTSHLAEELAGKFLDAELDEVYVLYAEFISPVKQEVALRRILPVLPEDLPEPSIEGVTEGMEPIIMFEPGIEFMAGHLLRRYLGMALYRVVFENVSSEHGARMTAMDSATNNADDMIATLTLHYNRARQAAITKELIEIVSGAEALK